MLNLQSPELDIAGYDIGFSPSYVTHQTDKVFILQLYKLNIQCPEGEQCSPLWTLDNMSI